MKDSLEFTVDIPKVVWILELLEEKLVMYILQMYHTCIRPRHFSVAIQVTIGLKITPNEQLNNMNKERMNPVGLMM